MMNDWCGWILRLAFFHSLPLAARKEPVVHRYDAKHEKINTYISPGLHIIG
jgi:hypothetical protein